MGKPTFDADSEEILDILDSVPMQELLVKFRTSVRTTLSTRIAHVLQQQGTTPVVGIGESMCLVEWTPQLFEDVLEELVRNTTQVIPGMVAECLVPESDDV